MRKYLARRRGRVRLASLLLAGGMLAGAAACTPTKPPPPVPPPPPPPSAVLSISPASLDYGEIETGGGTDPFTLTVTNNGPDDSGELGVTIDQPEPVQFHFGKRIPGVDDTCSTEVLSEGETCTVGIEFAPTSDGEHHAALLVTADVGATVSAALSGTSVSH